MKKQLILTVVLMGMAGAIGQAQGRYDDRRNDDRGFGRSYGRESYRSDPVRSTIETLYAIEARGRFDRHEASHLRRAVQELTEFANRRQRGRFDRGSLDDAIRQLRELAQADQLHPRDRQLIAGHLRDLYNLRGGGDNWRY